MSEVAGVVVGIVKNLNDPQNLGRIEVHFPWLSDENKSYWARVATLMAGAGRGSWFMPEVDDEVLVAFEQGDTQHPYIVGFLWNGKDKPPNSGIDTRVRRLRTVSDHVLEFDDRPGQERVLLTTQGGHQIELKDTPPASITIRTNGGQTVALKDLPASVTIQTAAGNQIVVSDAPPGITIQAPTGPLTITCLTATVNASTLASITAPVLNVNAGVTQFSGVVIAPAVVGAAYTPAPGNTFGL